MVFLMSVSENLKNVRTKILKACVAAGRGSDSVHLVAVSKFQSDTKIEEALTAGQRVFGENRVQEACAHWTEKRNKYPDLKLHLIGALQTNKIRDAVSLFDVIETVDREKLACKLGKEMEFQGRFLPCFVQINTGEESQKAGISPLALEDFLEYCRTECRLNVTGLMCIPPVDEPASLHFALLKKMADRYGLAERSMGMSSDYEKAIALGATYVRVGTSIFGERA